MTHTVNQIELQDFLTKNRDTKSAKGFNQQGVYPHLCGYGFWALKNGQEYVKNALKIKKVEKSA